MKSLFFSYVFLKIALSISGFLVVIGFIEYMAYPDLKNIILFFNGMVMLFLPYLLYKYFEVSFSKNKVAIFSFFIGICFVSGCIFYASQILLHPVIDPERKVEIAETVKKRYIEGYEQVERRIAKQNGGANVKIEKHGDLTRESIYNDAIDRYSIGYLASKPFRNLPYYLIFSLLATVAVLKFNQNHDE